MSFPWLDRTPPRDTGATKRAEVAAAEIADRAATLFRLGFKKEEATQRLTDRIAWEHDHPNHPRHESLTDQAIAKIVADTYARRPGHW